MAKIETPLLRVSRPVSACQRCRNVKVKCDGKLPACTACEKAGRSDECSSANDQFAKGKERSYVASLETRVERLERQIAQVKAKQSSANQPTTSHANVPEVPEPGAVTRSSRDQRKETRDVNDLVSDFGFLSVNATSRDFHGFTEQMSFARLVISASAQEPMPTFTANLLPQKHAITHLVEHYLENIHALYPFLSETNVFAAIDAVYQGYGSAMQHWTTRMVLAVALASLSRRRGDTFYQDAKRHAAGAFEFLESVVHPGSIPGIQAMLLLVLYSLFDPHHFESWYLIGLASRAMVDIGMHQEPPRDVELKSPSHELSKRVFTCIYSLDRSISMVHRRGFSFTDDSTSVTGPIQSAQSNSAFGASQLFLHNLEAGIQMNGLRRIQSHAYQRLFQSNRPNSEVAWPFMSSAIQDMYNWLEALPDTTKSPMKQLFRSDILFTSILILSPPGLERTLCDYGEFLIFEFATEYADLMASINQDRETFRFSTYHDVLSASFVAQRLVHTLSESKSLYTGVLPKAPPNSIPPAGPIISTARTVGEIVNKSHRCLDQLERYFEHQGPRYGYSEPLNDFKSQSRGVRQSIQERYDTWNRSLGVSRGQYLSSRPYMNEAQL